MVDANPKMRARWHTYQTRGRRGQAYLRVGDYKEALEDLNRAIELNPQYFDGYHWRGNLYEEIEDFDAAIADYTRAIQLDPNDPHMLYDRATLYERLREYELALADFRAYRELDDWDFVFLLEHFGTPWDKIK